MRGPSYHRHHSRFPVPGILPNASSWRLAAAAAAPLLDSLEPRRPIPDEAHLTVSTVRYELHGDGRAGVASGYFADRDRGRTRMLPVYIQSNRIFVLPADDVPIIMIGAGTGVAPYRAFMQEREARGAAGRSWLFFGERNFRTDFLYQANGRPISKTRF